MPAISERIINNSTSDENSVFTNSLNKKKSPLAGSEFVELSVSSNEFWSKHHVVSGNQLQEFWCGLTQQARRKLMRIDKQTLFEHARKSMYCSRCNGLLLEGFLHIVMYGKSVQQGVSSDNFVIRASKKDGDSCNGNGCQDDAYDPSVHPWGGLTTTKDGTLTLLDCYICSKSLKVVQNVFDSARSRERERELLYPDACGGDSRGWTSQGSTNYGRGHGTRETCALHTAQLSVDTLEDFWSALGEETRHSLMKMKEEDFIERLMYRFDSKRFCRDCRRNVIREFKQLKELKRMRRETRCSRWFCAADTAFQYEVSHDTVLADWHQTFLDSLGTYHHFEWAIGTGEGKSDILEFENVGLSVRVKVNGLDLNDLNACYITLRAWKKDGRCNELCVKAHALQGQHCVHCRLVVGDGFITITRGESIRRFFEHAEEAEEEEDDDSMDKDGNDFEGECSRPQKHAKSPELAREFLLDAATVIFKEQVEKAFREGTARQNAHSMFVSLALKLLEKRLHVACKDIVTLEKQMKLLEEEEKEKREEEARKQRRERKRTKEREKKLRRKERLKEKEKTENENECVEESSLVIDDSSMKDSTGDDVSNDVVESKDCTSETGEASLSLSSSDIKEEEDDDDQQLLLAEEEYIYSNVEENTDRKFEPVRNNTTSFSYDDHYHQHSRRKLRYPQPEWNSRKYDSRNRAGDGYEYSKRTTNSDSNNQLPRVAGPKLISDKCQCPPNNRGGIKYDSHSCSNTHHHNEHHSKPSTESRAWLIRDHPKYTTNKPESVASDNAPKPYYRGNNKYSTQVESATRDNSGGGRPKNKVLFGNPVKKVWEPLDSQKRYVRSNSDSDITLRSKPPKVVETSESDQLQTDEFSGTGNDQVTIDTISVSINDHLDAADSNKCSSSVGNGLKNSQKYLKKAASEDGELLTLVDSSISTSSNCSSCLSEGDSNNSSPNHLELASASSDSEESVQNASEATRDTSRCPLETPDMGRSYADANKIQENDSARITMVSSDNLPSEAAVSRIENGGNVFSSSGMGALPQSVIPQMHNNQSIHYPIFHHAPPAMGYYHHHQTPVTWPVGPANGLMSVPPHHSNHYLFTNSYGYGLNGNGAAHLMQFGGLQHLPPPLLNTAAHPSVFQPAVSHINGVSSKEEYRFDGGNAVVGELKEAQHHTLKEPKDAENPHNNNKMDKGNDNGFSLFHFSGPAALSTGFIADPVALKEGDVSPKKDSIEEYNLFAASNGIKFSFF